MKIAILSPYATVAPHFETELEIAQQHLDQHHDVECISCFGKLHNCDFNLDRNPARCEDCVGRRKAGFQMLQPAIRSVELEPENLQSILPIFKDLEELKAFYVDNFDVGYAALSSLVSVCRDPEPDLQRWQPLLQRLMQSALTTYHATRKYLTTSRPDRVYLFNGRFAAMRAVLRACTREQVDCFIHERGCDNYHYDLFKNHLPHDIKAIQETMLKQWQQAAPDREDVAAQWYCDRVNRVEKNWHSFTKGQVTGRMPSQWNNLEKNLTIFCSSDDEFVAIGDHWKNTLYPNQLEGIKRVVTDMASASPETKIYLRVHPNLKDVDNQSKREMLNLQSPNLTVIPPEATVDTYEMVRRSDSVATFGSSVGIEAVYWGTPSILLGPSFYNGLGGVRVPDNHKAALALFTQKLEPTERTAALIYGYWQQTHGIPYRYFEPTGLFEGKFKGQIVYSGMKQPKPRLFRRALQLVQRKAMSA